MVSAKTDNRELRAIGASPGIAIGPVRITDRSRVAVVETEILPAEIPAEVERFKNALAAAQEELRAIKEELEAQRGAEHLYVLDTHLLILQDSMLTRETVAIHRDRADQRRGGPAEDPPEIQGVFRRDRRTSISESGALTSRRSSSVSFAAWSGSATSRSTDMEGRSIIVAHDLSPADVLQIDKSKVIGFVTDLGGKTSHSAILARALEIPAVVGLERITAEISEDDVLIIDGFDRRGGDQPG